MSDVYYWKDSDNNTYINADEAAAKEQSGDNYWTKPTIEMPERIYRNAFRCDDSGVITLNQAIVDQIDSVVE